MTPFKKFYGLVVVGLLAFGCDRDNKAVVPQAENQPLTVKVNQTSRIRQNVTLNVDAIQDSRCPANATCIWYGNASVKFTLKDESQSKTGELCLGQCGNRLKESDATTIQLGDKRFEVTLSEVRPFPGTDSSGKPQEAVINVQELN